MSFTFSGRLPSGELRAVSKTQPKTEAEIDNMMIAAMTSGLEGVLGASEAARERFRQAIERPQVSKSDNGEMPVLETASLRSIGIG